MTIVCVGLQQGLAEYRSLPVDAGLLGGHPLRGTYRSKELRWSRALEPRG